MHAQIIADVEAVEAALACIERATAGMDDNRIDGTALALVSSVRAWLDSVADVAVDRYRRSH